MALQTLLTHSRIGNVVSRSYSGHCCKPDNPMAKGSDPNVGIWKLES
jgi:hypothetical protein